MTFLSIYLYSDNNLNLKWLPTKRHLVFMLLLTEKLFRSEIIRSFRTWQELKLQSSEKHYSMLNFNLLRIWRKKKHSKKRLQYILFRWKKPKINSEEQRMISRNWNGRLIEHRKRSKCLKVRKTKPKNRLRNVWNYFSGKSHTERMRSQK